MTNESLEEFDKWSVLQTQKLEAEVTAAVETMEFNRECRAKHFQSLELNAQIDKLRLENAQLMQDLLIKISDDKAPLVLNV